MAAKTPTTAQKAPKKKAAKKVVKSVKARKTPAKRSPAAKNSGTNGKTLVIVESPAKAKTIEKYLAKDFPNLQVVASIGHVVDLPVNSLGVDIDNDFAPNYEVIKGKKKIVDDLKRRARAAERIFLAPDPDREGEAIAYHIAQQISHGNQEIHRAVFNEVTRDAIRSSIENPTDINTNLFNAQQARRILDRLVGYKISPLLWKKVRRGLSAGRVQSVSLRLICDREREIRKFEPVEYWSIEALAKASTPPPFMIRLAKIDGKKPEISNQKASDRILDEVRDQAFTVGDVQKKQIAKRPFPPFITSTLQQEASRKLRFAARRTMRIAQRLYEGVELGSEGPTGLITYMRTDSTRLSNSSLENIRGYIHDQYESDYLPAKARFWAKGKAAQDAHEAIRPTDIRRTPADVASYLDKDMLAVYTLIWKRAIASQMADAQLDRTRIEIPIGRYLFIATGSVVAFPGFLKIYEESRDESGKTESDAEGAVRLHEEGDEALPRVERGEKLAIEDLKGNQHFTQPPPRFTEAGLIRELERQGIGRPSTYAQIISTIQDREYATKEKGSFQPTDLGIMITDLLVEHFAQIMDVKFTALMEDQLDEVEEGRVDWVSLLRNFYTPFLKTLETAEEQMRNVKAEVVETEYTCDKCESPMVVRWGRNGKFLACSAFPKCRNTKPIIVSEDGKVEIVKDEETDRKCPNCGKTMVIKSGRRGRFLACSGYPECKTSQPLPIGVPCPRPGCKGEMVERQSGRGKTFYSCSAYPECRFLVGERPRKITCEGCGQEHFIGGKPSNPLMFGEPTPQCPYSPIYTGEKEGGTSAKPRKKKKSASRKKSATRKKSAPKAK